jgi:prepilin-type processing-associated H-X9-DG protein
MCLGNMKQIGLAMHNYAGDNNGFLPYGAHCKSAGTYKMTWDDLLSYYTGKDLSQAEMEANVAWAERPLYLCPADSTRGVVTAAWFKQRSYTMLRGDNAGPWATKPGPGVTHGVTYVADEDNAALPFSPWSASLYSLADPDGTILLTERGSTAAAANILGNNGGAIVDNPENQVSVALFHGNAMSMNYLHCDGHAFNSKPYSTVGPGGTPTVPRGSWTRIKGD